MVSPTEQLTPRDGRRLAMYVSIPLAISALVAVGLYLAISAYLMRDAQHKIQNVLLSHRGFHHYIQQVMHPAFYRAREQGEVAETFYAPEILSSSFIVRHIHFFQNEERRKAGLPEIYYKMAANNPRNPVNQADAFEESLIRMFNEKRGEAEFHRVVTENGQKYLYYAKPFLVNTRACLKCHGNREDAPPGLQVRYPGQGGFNEKEGEIRAIESIRMPVGGEISMALVLTGSLTSGLLATLGLILFNTRLRSTVRSKTASLAGEISIRQAREGELEKKNAELERFTYTVSHDLKSPLITIKGFAGALQRDIASGRHDRLASDLKRITDAADKMANLLDDLLDLSRIGRIIDAPSLVPMSSVVHDALARLEGTISTRHVEMVVSPHLPDVNVDRPRMVEVIQNLVENAIKYMGDQATPRVEIGSRADEEGTVFFVRDNGMGVESRYHESVFGLFDKLDARSEGTGIGLALVRRILEFHGGRIWVESEGLGRGSTFCFTLGEPLPAPPEGGAKRAD